MTLKLNETGLPLPGRELDAWICEHILKWEWDRSTLQDLLIAPDGHIAAAIFHEAPEDERFAALPPLLPVSTTHTYHQVMEAMTEWYWEFVENPSELWAFVTDGTGREEPIAYAKVLWIDYPNREAAYAYAVCACAYLAKGGEG